MPRVRLRPLSSSAAASGCLHAGAGAIPREDSPARFPGTKKGCTDGLAVGLLTNSHGAPTSSQCPLHGPDTGVDLLLTDKLLS